MNIDRRITNGLAWAGVILVVGVPVADLVTSQFAGNPARPAPAQVAVVERIAPIPAPLSQRPAAPVAAPVTEVAAVTPARPVTPAATTVPAKPATEVATVAPATPAPTTPAATPARPAAQTADAVDAWLNSGKPLPSYITEGSQPTQVAATPPARTPIVTTPAAIDPIQVAAIAPQKVAPTPMPLSMRPRSVTVAATPAQAIVLPPGLTPATPNTTVRPPGSVTAADLDDWETGPLSEFLAQRQAGNADPAYDPDGFFLDQGPNQRPRPRNIPPASDEPFFLFFD